MPVRKRWWRMKKAAWYIRNWGLVGYAKREFFVDQRVPSPSPSPKAAAGSFGVLNLQPGDLVEVRSEKEIFGTLDQHGKLKGLVFQREMTQFCSKQYRVYKRLNRLIVEATGEKRTVKSPTVLLEGVICDGSAHEGCDRSCFLFWREEWLRKVASAELSKPSAGMSPVEGHAA